MSIRRLSITPLGIPLLLTRPQTCIGHYHTRAKKWCQKLGPWLEIHYDASRKFFHPPCAKLWPLNGLLAQFSSPYLSHSQAQLITWP